MFKRKVMKIATAILVLSMLSACNTVENTDINAVAQTTTQQTVGSTTVFVSTQSVINETDNETDTDTAVTTTTSSTNTIVETEQTTTNKDKQEPLWYTPRVVTVTDYDTYSAFFDAYTDMVWDLVPYDFNNDGTNDLLIVNNLTYRTTLLYMTAGHVAVLPLDGHNGRVYSDGTGNILSIDDSGDTYGTYGYLEGTIYTWNGTEYTITQQIRRDAGYVEYDDAGNIKEDVSYYGQAYIDDAPVDNVEYDTCMQRYSVDVTNNMTHYNERISAEEIKQVLDLLDEK